MSINIKIAKKVVAMGSANTLEERSESVTAGGIRFKSMGRIECEKACFIEHGNFDGEDFLVATDFSIVPWINAGISICP